MKKVNQYGYSFEMSEKSKEAMKNYSPENVSDLTALRNRKPLRLINTMKRVEMRVHSQPLTLKEEVNVSLTLLTVIVFLWALFNL